MKNDNKTQEKPANDKPIEHDLNKNHDKNQDKK